MPTVATLEAIITADASQAKDVLSSFGDTMEGLGSKVGAFATGFAELGAIGVAGFSGALIAAGDYEKQLALLGAIEASSIQRNADIANGMKGVAIVTHMTRDEIDQFANSMEATTTYSKESTIAAIRWSETFTSISKETMPSAVEAAMNLSTVFGRDLRTSIIMVDKALQDPVKGVDNLRRIGVQFTDQQKTQLTAMMAVGNVAGAQAMIMHELTIELGGAAKAMGGTFQGQLEILGNTFRRVFQHIGDVVLPGLKSFVDVLNEVLRGVITINPDFIKFAFVITGIGVAIGGVVAGLALLLSPLGLIGTAVGALWLAWDSNFGNMKESVKGFLTSIQPYLDDIRKAIQNVIDFVNPHSEEQPKRFVRDRQRGENNNPNQVAQGDGGSNQTGLVHFKEAAPPKQTTFLENMQRAIQYALPGFIEALKGIGAQIITSINNDVFVPIGKWFTTIGVPAFKGFWKSVFNVDLSTSLKTISEAWDKVIYPALKPILDGISNTIDELKKVDWTNAIAGFGDIVKGLLTIGLAVVIVAGLGLVVSLQAIGRAIALIADAAALMHKGDIGGALGKLSGGLVLLAGAFLILNTMGGGSVLTKLVTAITPMVAEAFTAGLSALGISLPAVATGFLALAGSLAPFVIGGAIILGVVALVALIMWMIGHMDEVGKAMGSIGAAMADLGQKIGGAFVAGVKAAIGIMITLLQAAAIVFGAIHDYTNATAAANSALNLQAWLDGSGSGAPSTLTGPNVNGVPVKTGNPTQPPTQSGGPYTPGGPNDPFKKKQSGQGGDTINVGKIIVNNPQDSEGMYKEIVKEAKRNGAPIGKQRTVYA